MVRVFQLVLLAGISFGCSSKIEGQLNASEVELEFIHFDAPASRYCEVWDGSPLRPNERVELVSSELGTISIDAETREQTFSAPGSFYIIKPVNDELGEFSCRY